MRRRGLEGFSSRLTPHYHFNHREGIESVKSPAVVVRRDAKKILHSAVPSWHDCQLLKQLFTPNMCCQLHKTGFTSKL